PVEAEREGPAGERRQLTVLFCDLVGSTGVSGKLDPEDWRELVATYHAAAGEVIARFGGHVAQHLGDGLLVVPAFALIGGRRSVQGWYSGVSIDSEDTLAFSASCRPAGAPS
ncbi:MAG: hypothetical protein ACREI8_10630, partial [Myxococcota bacterium]